MQNQAPTRDSAYGLLVIHVILQYVQGSSQAVCHTEYRLCSLQLNNMTICGELAQVVLFACVLCVINCCCQHSVM